MRYQEEADPLLDLMNKEYFSQLGNVVNANRSLLKLRFSASFSPKKKIQNAHI